MIYSQLGEESISVLKSCHCPFTCRLANIVDEFDDDLRIHVGRRCLDTSHVEAGEFSNTRVDGLL